MKECGFGWFYIRVRDRQGLYNNAGVAGLMLEYGSGMAYVRMRKWNGLYKNAAVVGLM